MTDNFQSNARISTRLWTRSGGNKRRSIWAAGSQRTSSFSYSTARRGVDVGVKHILLMKPKERRGYHRSPTNLRSARDVGRLIVMKDGRIAGVIGRDRGLTEQSVIGVMI